MDLLARREHSRVELFQKLRKRFEEEDLIHPVLDKLTEEGLLSNARFTENYIRWRQAHGFGPYRIKSELKERGVDESIINEYLNVNASCWFESAKLARDKKFKFELSDSAQERAKEYRFLQFRGFTQEQINTIYKTRKTPS